ncbi:MAG TPA: helix-turn-helix domain-containing protein [Aliidongia sp.]|uniref:IclR family transcriptional regulator n=1 Tax=Aliidongia sp. TaxID=1914230 RepID=UPI002DDCDBA1|nr:helix-turn-helix domain-containing protein [Aliidongia sp.]HEV2673780.1 helix-turn-helix domain-containing protein [Aliidongia sp.]
MPQDQARSIKRTLEVLEYFDEENPSASVGSISRDLGYPQSSTSILLKSLLNLGYLSYDDKTRTYRPTARVALLGRGIRSHLLGDGNLMAALDELSTKTGELIFLASQAGLSVHYIHVIPATNPLRMHLRAGAVRPLAGSSSGHLFLAARTDADIATIVKRSQEVAEPGKAPDLDDVMREVRKIRKAGYVLSTRTVTPGGGVLGMMLPQQFEHQPLAICLGGVGSVVTENADRFVRIMADAIARHFPSPASQSA